MKVRQAITALLTASLFCSWMFAVAPTAWGGSSSGSDPVSICSVFPGQPHQVVKGLGFEIQCDSIGSGNHGLPDNTIAVPHDLVPPERERLATEM